MNCDKNEYLLVLLMLCVQSYTCAQDSLTTPPCMYTQHRCWCLGISSCDKSAPISFSANYTKNIQQKRYQEAQEAVCNDSSLLEAINAYIEVYYFDSLSIIAQQAKIKLDSFRQLLSQNIQAQILGEWQWIWTGSSWNPEGTNPENSTVWEHISVERDSIDFNRNIGRQTYAYGVGLEYWELSDFWSHPEHLRLRIYTSDCEGAYLDWHWWLHKGSEKMPYGPNYSNTEHTFVEDYTPSLMGAGSIWKKMP